MINVDVERKKIPLWYDGAKGSLVLKAELADPTAVLAPTPRPIVDASFSLSGGSRFSFGHAGSTSLGVQANTAVRLAPVWKEQQAGAAALVKDYRLGAFLKPDNLLLIFHLGGGASLSGQGSFRYGPVHTGAHLEAGTQGAYLYARAFDRQQPFVPMVAGFFKGMRLPSAITVPPEPGEISAFEFSGHLKLGLSASAGYEIKGTRSLDIATLKLSEHYKLSVLGRLAFSAAVAGRYAVEVRAGSQCGWARVTVRRCRAGDIRVAADVTVEAKLDTQGLPETGKEFLEALLGIRAANWINLIDTVADETGRTGSLDSLKRRLDSLAADFIKRYAGKGIDKITSQAEVQKLLARLDCVVKSCRELDQSAISLFDRFFDPVLDRTGELEARLDELLKLPSLDRLQGEVDPVLWNAVRQLTGGDPLNWILGVLPGGGKDSLAELKHRASQALSIVRDRAHEEIREVIKIAKTEFGLDRFLEPLSHFSSGEQLKAQAGKRLKGFVQRLIGEELDKLNGKDLKRAFDIVQKVAQAKDRFCREFDEKLREAASQSLSLTLHSEYSRADERTALVDLEIRLLAGDGTPFVPGQELMSAAGRGDFSAVLASYQPEVVRLLDGALTHRVTRVGMLRFNVAGWHSDFSYRAIHRVITDANQQIRTGENGALTVFTTIDMSAETDRRRKGSKAEERIQTSFLLRLIGETSGVLKDSDFSKRDLAYAVETIMGFASSYGVTFVDEDTSEGELDDYLSFARDLGLDTKGATKEALLPLLEKKNGGFGSIEAEYKVRFSEQAVADLLRNPISEDDVRLLLKKIVLSNYADHPTLDNVAWLYLSEDVQKLWRSSGNFIYAESVLNSALDAGVTITIPVPGILPGRLRHAPREQRVVLHALFSIEDRMVEAFSELQMVISAGRKVKLAEFEKKLAKFGDVLNSFDEIDRGENSTFFVFDGLVKKASTDPASLASSMVFSFDAGGARRIAVF